MELNEDETLLENWLKQMRDVKIQAGILKGFHYRGIEDFVLQHGVWYRPNGLRPPTKGAPKACFGNALFTGALHGLKYIEGFSLAPKLPFAIHHAWNLDVNGNLADTTWLNSGLAYLGVEFSLGRADNAAWFDDGTVLDNPRSRQKLYRQPWTGENYNLVWRRSKPMREIERIRRGTL